MHLPALGNNEARHNILLAELEAMADGQASDTVTWSLGAPGQCAMMTPGRPIRLGDLDEAQCGALAEQTAQTEYVGVIGPDDTAHHFARRAAQLGVEFDEPMPQRIYGLSEKPNYPGATGNARCATSSDVGLLADWIASFIRDAGLRDRVPPRERLEFLASREHVFWVVDDEPVSMAAILRKTRKAASINSVYTPPALRGRGYAAAVTAAAVEQIFADGRTIACLYTDVRNPSSNRCYAKVGFKPVCDSAHIPRLLADKRQVDDRATGRQE